MKILITMTMAAALMACGSKAKTNTTTPDNSNTNTTEPAKTDGTGGATYGGEQPATPPAPETTPSAGQ